MGHLKYLRTKATGQISQIKGLVRIQVRIEEFKCPCRALVLLHPERYIPVSILHGLCQNHGSNHRFGRPPALGGPEWAHPTFWNGFWGRRGRQDPQTSTISGRPQKPCIQNPSVQGLYRGPCGALVKGSHHEGPIKNGGGLGGPIPGRRASEVVQSGGRSHGFGAVLLVCTLRGWLLEAITNIYF